MGRKKNLTLNKVAAAFIEIAGPDKDAVIKAKAFAERLGVTRKMGQFWLERLVEAGIASFCYYSGPRDRHHVKGFVMRRSFNSSRNKTL